MKSGIYKIENLESGTVYVGQSIDVVDRLWHHKCNLRGNRQHNMHLQSAYNKYGEEVFVFAVLQYCEVGDLTTLEQAWLDHFMELGPVYNKGEVTDSPRLGTTHTEATKRKMSETHKGLTMTEEHKRNLSLAAYRRPKRGPMSEQHKSRISLALKGKRLPTQP